MDSYTVNIKSILDDLGATTEVSGTFDLTRLLVGTEVFVFKSPVRFEVWITNTGTSVVSGGTVVGDAVATCSRCLCDFPLEIVGEVDGFYVFHGKEQGIPEDQEFEFIDDDGVIDVLPSLMAALVLEAPYAPVHDEECAGLCSMCGADLNEGQCGCSDSTPADHPFAALGALLEQDGGSEV